MEVKVCVFLFVVTLSLAWGQQNEAPDCGSTTINCICSIGEGLKYVPMELKAETIQDPTTGEQRCSGLPDPYQVCANISCYLAPLNGTGPGENGKDFLSNFYPQEIVIPRTAGPPEGRRFPRQIEPCFVQPLKNAEVKCWKWPNWINCDINCITGYAMQGPSRDTVTSMNVNCRLTENTWKPTAIQDCEPYVNCKVHLVKPGDLKCTEPMNGPAFCEISCLDYDDFEATSKQKYECVDDNFAHSLPHCATLVEGVKLIHKPN